MYFDDVTWGTESVPTDMGISEWDWSYMEGTLSGFIGRVRKMKLRVSALEIQDNQEQTNRHKRLH